MPFRDFSAIMNEKFGNYRLAFFGYGQKQPIPDFLRLLGPENPNIELDIALAVEGSVEGLFLLGKRGSIQMDFYSQLLSSSVGNFMSKKSLLSVPGSFRSVVYNTSHHRLVHAKKTLKLVKTKQVERTSEFHPCFDSICNAVQEVVRGVLLKKNDLFGTTKTRFEVYLHLSCNDNVSWRRLIEDSSVVLLEEMKTYQYMACRTADLLEMIQLLGSATINVFSHLQSGPLTFSSLHFALKLFEKFRMAVFGAPKLKNSILEDSRGFAMPSEWYSGTLVLKECKLREKAILKSVLAVFETGKKHRKVKAIIGLLYFVELLSYDVDDDVTLSIAAQQKPWLKDFEFALRTLGTRRSNFSKEISQVSLISLISLSVRAYARSYLDSELCCYLFSIGNIREVFLEKLIKLTDITEMSIILNESKNIWTEGSDHFDFNKLKALLSLVDFAQFSAILSKKGQFSLTHSMAIYSYVVDILDSLKGRFYQAKMFVAKFDDDCLARCLYGTIQYHGSCEEEDDKRYLLHQIIPTKDVFETFLYVTMLNFNKTMLDKKERNERDFLRKRLPMGLRCHDLIGATGIFPFKKINVKGKENARIDFGEAYPINDRIPLNLTASPVMLDSLIKQQLTYTSLSLIANENCNIRNQIDEETPYFDDLSEKVILHEENSESAILSYHESENYIFNTPLSIENSVTRDCGYRDINDFLKELESKPLLGPFVKGLLEMVISLQTLKELTREELRTLIKDFTQWNTIAVREAEKMISQRLELFDQK